LAYCYIGGVFSYPGSKNRLAPHILRLLPMSGERFVDVFAGRGSVSFAVLANLQYEKMWINAKGTHEFFEALQFLGSFPHKDTRLRFFRNYQVPQRSKAAYEREKAFTVRASLLDQALMYEEAGRPDLGADIRRELAGLPEEEQRQPCRKIAEAFLSFGGGTFSANGRRVGKGGPGRQGFISRAMSASDILYENRNRITITHLDYRSVLAELGPGDVAYLDPCYRGYDMGTYNDSTIDYEDLVRTLSGAKFRWVLSEYFNEVYAPLGEPIRIVVRKSNPRGGMGQMAEECLWSNFEPRFITEPISGGSHLATIDLETLLKTLHRERDEIDAAIAVVTRTAQRNFNSPSVKQILSKSAGRRARRSPSLSSKKSQTAAADAPKGKGRKYTDAQREAMSKKLKAAWAKRKKQPPV
jgi:hypothetical protein